VVDVVLLDNTTPFDNVMDIVPEYVIGESKVSTKLITSPALNDPELGVADKLVSTGAVPSIVIELLYGGDKLDDGGDKLPASSTAYKLYVPSISPAVLS